MAGFGMIAPGVTVDNFGSGARTGFGGFLGRWGDAYRNGMTIGREQGKLNSQYSLDQTKQNTEINNARQDDHLRQIEYAAMRGDKTALQMLNAYKKRQQNNPAAAVGANMSPAPGVGRTPLTSYLGEASTTPNPVGYSPSNGDESPNLTTWADEDSSGYREDY
jgi:hypothetical protein